ncbi:hypothetical protein HOE67_03855 [Candidatus Peregrinibacteria bacterium]|jgi:hypothetical protein|nr:hypothetical protein [Candidatus Peregrinibacteria bacterium]MBT4056221.1 hypothetical protein [Candidatus Peregrinibacteria bacterium]
MNLGQGIESVKKFATAAKALPSRMSNSERLPEQLRGRIASPIIVAGCGAALLFLTQCGTKNQASAALDTSERGRDVAERALTSAQIEPQGVKEEVRVQLGDAIKPTQGELPSAE